MSDPTAPPEPFFSVCCLVTDPVQHAAMCASFRGGGFTSANTEFIAYGARSGPRFDAYAGIGRMLEDARGRYAVLVRQDVRLLADGATELEARLAELTERDPDWAVAGNAGVTAEGEAVMRLTEGDGPTAQQGTVPARVASLDESFIVVRRATGLRPSAGLAGYQLFGTDLCLQARLLGRTAWAIDFNVRRLGTAGRLDRAFFDHQEAFERLWGQRLGQSERIRTPRTTLTLRSGLGSELLGRWRLSRLRARLDR
ncbi:hypothetical protein [Falsiroseomonas oryziterrae]|uniref:hypothetical protein n=1 Tax=Falsiroseomonas oryziterrae TaxID=2911368 RepID=UPI001F47509F|nr:hypothetical protein [Roseomonas sp. NPKOSM-4]